VKLKHMQRDKAMGPPRKEKTRPRETAGCRAAASSCRTASARGYLRAENVGVGGRLSERRPLPLPCGRLLPATPLPAMPGSPDRPDADPPEVGGSGGPTPPPRSDDSEEEDDEADMVGRSTFFSNKGTSAPP